jgi:hypothetical protein
MYQWLKRRPCGTNPLMQGASYSSGRFQRMFGWGAGPMSYDAYTCGVSVIRCSLVASTRGFGEARYTRPLLSWPFGCRLTSRGYIYDLTR